MANGYKEMAVNRPMIIKRGWPGNIRVNEIQAYIGEWVVFELPISDTNNMEIRMPIEDALESGLVIASDRIQYTSEDFEDTE